MSNRGPLYVRLEHEQWGFARSRARSFDGAIVAVSHLAPYPAGHPSFGQPADRLELAVIEAKRALVIDPGTPMLESPGVVTYDSAKRLRGTAAANAVALPLVPAALRAGVARDRLVDATMQDQSLGRAVAAPYIEPTARDDERHRMNLQMLRRVVRSAGTQVPVAFIQVTRGKLLAGLLAELAGDYAATGISRVFIRVRGLKQDASPAELSAYLDALDAFQAHGLGVIADCVGRLGPLLVREGALGFSTGTMYYRTIPRELLHARGGGGGVALTVETPDGWSELPRDSAGASQMDPCAELDCPVGRRRIVDLDDLREHRLHVLSRATARLRDQDIVVVANTLAASGLTHLRGYAAVLLERERRAA